MSLRSQKFNVYKWHKDIICGCCENSADEKRIDSHKMLAIVKLFQNTIHY